MPSCSNIEQWWQQTIVVRDEKSSVWIGHLLIMTVVQRYMQQKKAIKSAPDISYSGDF
jgi:hypothetical protein